MKELHNEETKWWKNYMMKSLNDNETRWWGDYKSLGDTTNPSTWLGMDGQSLGPAPSCIVLDLEPNHDASEFKGQVLMMRSLGADGRTKVQKSGSTDILLPLPFGFGAPPPSTPVGLGVSVTCGRFELLKETCIIAHVIKVELRADSKVSHIPFGLIKPFAKVSPTQIKRYIPTAIFQGGEVARIKAYMKRGEKGPMTPLIPVLGKTLTPATMGSHLNSPSSSRAALAGGTTARPWSQIFKKGVNKATTDKAATDKTTAETQRRRYVLASEGHD